MFTNNDSYLKICHPLGLDAKKVENHWATALFIVKANDKWWSVEKKLKQNKLLVTSDWKLQWIF